MSKKDGNGKIAEETNALMSNGRAKPEKQSFATFIYNKREGKCLGRTGKSWAQITIFYIIFYILLAAFWLACLNLFLSTIDEKLPRFYGAGTIIGANPGVGYQPWRKEDPESTLIKFNTNEESTFAPYVEALNAYLTKYDNIENTRECVGTQSNSDNIKDGKAENDEACRFDLTPFREQGCSNATDFGFRDGSPCIIVSLNRLIGWTPESFDAKKNDVPDEIKSRYKQGSIAFNCIGTNPHDKEYIGKIKYIPEQGIDGRFYPYAVMTNYQQPIAMVKFEDLPKNRIVMVECRAYAENIERDTESRLGMVTFELMREEK